MKHPEVAVCAMAMWLLVGPVGTLTQSGPSTHYVPLGDIRHVLADRATAAPADLPGLSGSGAEGRWLAWVASRDQGIRQRLRDGDKDTLLNWLLLGRSFTTVTPVRLESNADGSAVQAATVAIRDRIDALVRALGSPGTDERRRFALSILEAEGLNVTTPTEQMKVRNYLLRGIQTMLQTAAPEPSTTPTSQFGRRGLSLDTSIAPGFAIEESLRTLKARGVIPAGGVRRVAIVGAGLDFADKNTGFDFYPVQTLQPFAVLDTLRRLDLAPPGAIDVVALDISTRVLDHITRARAVPAGYVLQLPLARSEPWSAALRSYWKTLGDQIGVPVSSAAQSDADIRAIRVPQAVVRTVASEDVNVIVARSHLGRFDLIVATNVLLYYSPFDQALALSNIEAMLNMGGIFLTNTNLPASDGSELRKIGSQVTLYTADRRGDEVTWYRRVARESGGQPERNIR